MRRPDAEIIKRSTPAEREQAYRGHRPFSHRIPPCGGPYLCSICILEGALWRERRGAWVREVRAA